VTTDLQIPGSAPPVIQSGIVEEVPIYLPDGTTIPQIQGTFNFHPGYQNRQRARIWIKTPADSDFRMTDIIIEPETSGTVANFAIPVNGPGQYEIKPVTESFSGNSLPFAVHPQWSRLVVGLPPPPGAVHTPSKLVSATGDALVRWEQHAGNKYSGEEDEIYEVEILDSVGNVKRGPIQIVVPSAKPMIWSHYMTFPEESSCEEVIIGKDGTISTTGMPSTFCTFESQRIEATNGIFRFKIDGRLPPLNFWLVGANDPAPFSADPATETFSFTGASDFENGNFVTLTSDGTLPNIEYYDSFSSTWLTASGSQGFWIVDKVDNNFKLSNLETVYNPIRINNNGSGTHYVNSNLSGLSFQMQQYLGDWYISPEGVPVNPSIRIPGSIRVPLPDDELAIEIIDNHGVYFYNRSDDNAIPAMRSWKTPAPKYLKARVTLGGMGGFAQAAIQCTVKSGSKREFLYTSSMQEQDFGSIQSIIRIKVRQISTLTGPGVAAIFVL
jgi:hypothetical protein